jgi:hypothetical protein
LSTPRENRAYVQDVVGVLLYDASRRRERPKRRLLANGIALP